MSQPVGLLQALYEASLTDKSQLRNVQFGLIVAGTHENFALVAAASKARNDTGASAGTGSVSMLTLTAEYWLSAVGSAHVAITRAL
jgi:hypothetical protein